MATIRIMKETEMTVEICPFCRDPDASYFVQSDGGVGKPQVTCSNCHAKGSIGDNAAEALTGWNRYARYQEVRVANARAEAVQETTQKLNEEIKGALLGQPETPIGL